MTAARNVAQVNRAIRKAGVPVTMFKGNGYFYFENDDIAAPQAPSVYVCYLYQLSIEQWIEAAKGE